MADERGPGEEARRTALQAAQTLEKRGLVDGAIQAYVAAGAPEEAARLLFAQKRYADAGKVLLDFVALPPAKVAQLDSSKKKAALQGAICYARAGENAIAVEWFVALGERERAAELLRRSGDVVGAARVAQGLKPGGVTTGPLPTSSAPRGMTLGAAQQLEQQGKFELAMEAYVGLRQPGHAARMCSRLGRHAQAADLYLQAGMPFEAATSWTEAGESARTLEALERVPREDPRYRQASVQAIRIASDLNALEFQLEHFLTRWLQDAPQSEREVEALYLLAKLYQKNDFIENARDAFQKVLRVNPGYRDVRQRLEQIDAETKGSALVYEKILREETSFRGDGGVTPAPLGFPDLPDLPGLPTMPVSSPSPVNQWAQGPVAMPPGARPATYPPGAPLAATVPPTMQGVPYATQAPSYPPLSPMPLDTEAGTMASVPSSLRTPGPGSRVPGSTPPPMYPAAAPPAGTTPPPMYPTAAPVPGPRPVVARPPGTTPPPAYAAPPVSRAPAPTVAPQAMATPAPTVAPQAMPAPAPTVAPQPSPPAPAAPAKLVLEPGSVIADRYRLEKKIGQGGMAAVFKAHDLELNEDVALKVFTKLVDDEQMIARFKQELLLSRQLNHPNIIRLYDIGMVQGFRYITMELLSGDDLKARLGRPLELREGIGYLLQSCAALQAAHDKGIVHRDIKPANLFLTDEGVVKLMDFGIAKRQATPGLTVAGMIAGTPEYMSPEQIQGFDKVTASTDLYALGIMAYEFFTGSVPFRHPEIMPLLVMQMSEPPPSPRAKNPKLPPELEAVILKLLEKDAANRYRSCRELATALEAVLRKLP